MTSGMKVSLILATVDRTEEVARLLASLAIQRDVDFELIVVDQNMDDRLQPILVRYQDTMRFQRVRSERGLSRARNVGLRLVSGDIVGFPDDDCWYPAGLLKLVVDALGTNSAWQGVTGRSEDGAGHPSGGRFDTSSGRINFKNVWTRAISYTIFVRREAVSTIGAFDEELGVGAGTRFGSAEETDFLIRGIRAGFHFTYMPHLIVFHPNPTKQFDERAWRRARSYGAGMGRVLRKHHYPSYHVGLTLARPAGGALLCAAVGNFARARYHWNVLRGRLDGITAM